MVFFKRYIRYPSGQASAIHVVLPAKPLPMGNDSASSLDLTVTTRYPTIVVESPAQREAVTSARESCRERNRISHTSGESFAMRYCGVLQAAGKAGAMLFFSGDNG